MDYLGVMVDMAGCPNRCRHCWLGSHKNGNMTVDDFRSIAGEFKNWRDENGQGIKELGFFSWWREPDYRDDYRELWKLEQELSSPGSAQRFELLSTWRLARDESYAKWATTLPPKACQITFFGMKENTDWFMRRKGAFHDQLLATERCLEAGIAPRWQLFLSKRCMSELDEFIRLIYTLNLHKRCKEIGQKFEFFIGGISPEGNGYEVEDIRITESDLPLIPESLISISRDGRALLGQPESELYNELINDNSPPNMTANMNSISVNADFDVFPNVAEPTEWWRLGNLKIDGADKIIKAYLGKTTPGAAANRTVKLSELAEKYGNPRSKKLYSKDDLISRFMRQWGEDYMRGKNLNI
ncbi:MAG: radical SAM protein [Eubacteriales bacterium]